MPGKFQGEPSYAEFFYDLAMDGDQTETFVDSFGVQIDVFRIEQEDYDKFQDLVNEEFIILWESDDGFVFSEVASSESDLIDTLETMGVDDEQIDLMSL